MTGEEKEDNGAGREITEEGQWTTEWSKDRPMLKVSSTPRWGSY